MQKCIFISMKQILFFFLSFSTLIPLAQAQEVENITRFHSSREGIYFRDIKKFGEYRYGVFEGGAGDLGKKDSMFYNGNFIEQDTSKGGNVWFFKMNDKHEVIFAGRFHDPKRTHRYLKRIFYHNGIVYFSLQTWGDLWYNGELILKREATELRFGPILVGVDEVTNKVVFVKGIDQNSSSGPEAIAFYGDRMYIGGTVNGNTSPDGHYIGLPDPETGVKGGYLLVYDLNTGEVVNSTTWGMWGYNSIADMKVDSKGNLIVLAATQSHIHQIGNDSTIQLPSDYANAIIQKYDANGELIGIYTFGNTNLSNATFHTEITILPDDRIAVFGLTYGYVKTENEDSIAMVGQRGCDISVLSEDLEMEWIDYYSYVPEESNNWLYQSDMASDMEGNIYITFGFFKPNFLESRQGEVLPRGYYFIKYNNSGQVLKQKMVQNHVHGTMIMDIIENDKLLVCHFEPAGDYNEFLKISQKYRQETYLFELNMDKLTSSTEDEVGENIEVTRIYPNPIGKDDILNISTQEDDDYKIYDVMGRIYGHGYSSGGKISLIDHQLRAGMYIIKFGSTSKYSARFIVQE